MTTDKTANTSVHLSEALKAKLRMRAAKRNVHISTIIREAIEDYLSK